MADWFDENGSGIVSPNRDAPMSDTRLEYSGDLPAGYSREEVQDFINRNGGDTSRVGTALNDRDASGRKIGGEDSSSSTASFSRSGFAAPTPYRAFTETFNAPTAPGDLMDKWDREFTFGEQEFAADPGVQYRSDEMQRAIERSAAARGTLLTGGTAVDLADRLGQLASQEWGTAHDRALTDYRNAFDIFGADRTRRSGEFDKTYGRAKGEYDTRFNIHNVNEMNRYNTERSNRMDDYGIFSADRAFDAGRQDAAFGQNLATQQFENQVSEQDWGRLFDFARLGLGATSTGAGAAQNYGNAGSGLIADRGNATAAGTVGSANAWNGAIGRIGDAATGWGYQTFGRQPQGAVTQ